MPSAIWVPMSRRFCRASKPEDSFLRLSGSDPEPVHAASGCFVDMVRAIARSSIQAEAQACADGTRARHRTCERKWRVQDAILIEQILGEQP